MHQTLERSSKSEPGPTVTPLLAADIGGTYARLGIVQSGGGMGQLTVLRYHKYHCRDYASLGDVVRAFLADNAETPITRAVLACSGYVVDDVVINDTLPWKVTVSDLRRSVQLDDLSFINDFEALAYATQHVDRSSATLLTSGVDDSVRGTQIVVGPGTGLGAAVIACTQHGPVVLPTEAGQVALAPGNRFESDLLRVLAGGDQHVPCERVLSGPGLLNLYRALCALEGVATGHGSPEAVTSAALGGCDASATRALEVFCSMLGSFLGDLVMLYDANGGVWLAGGILPNMRGFLLRSRFIERFLDKGHMRAFLQTVPIRLMEHGQLGLIGAAGWYLDRRK